MESMKNITVGVAVITHNARKHLSYCLPPLLQSPLNPRVLVVNSSSQDGTVEQAKASGAEVLVVKRADFNHGSTRERARKFLGTDIVVMVTPDAYAVDKDVLGKLIDPLLHGQAKIAYARQLPHDGANFFEAFSRAFNYPAESHVRGIDDAPTYGPYTVFLFKLFCCLFERGFGCHRRVQFCIAWRRYSCGGQDIEAGG